MTDSTLKKILLLLEICLHLVEAQQGFNTLRDFIEEHFYLKSDWFRLFLVVLGTANLHFFHQVQYHFFYLLQLPINKLYPFLLIQRLALNPIHYYFNLSQTRLYLLNYFAILCQKNIHQWRIVTLIWHPLQRSTYALFICLKILRKLAVYQFARKYRLSPLLFQWHILRCWHAVQYLIQNLTHTFFLSFITFCCLYFRLFGNWKSKLTFFNNYNKLVF